MYGPFYANGEYTVDERDFMVSSASYSLIGGHAGFDAKYVAASHEVVYTSWITSAFDDHGASEKQRYTKSEVKKHMPIPMDIQSQEDIIAYVRKTDDSFFHLT